MRTVRRALAAGFVLALVGPAGVAVADAGSGTATVKPAAEAWYRTTPTCTLPTSCVDLSTAPSPFPAGTLHVAVIGDQEMARTYLRLDLSALPYGTKPVGGTLHLPVASEADGSILADMATLQACAVTGSVSDVDGAFTPPPTADCAKASTPATYAAAAGTAPATFTVNLSALAAAWEAGASPGAIALLPAPPTLVPPAVPPAVPAATPPATWLVAFSGRQRTGDGVVPISASVTYASAAVDDDFDFGLPEEEVPVDTAPATNDLGGSAPPPFVGGSLPEAGPAPVTATPQSPATTPVASVVSRGFQYPAVFLFPLVLAIGAGYLGRALTRDLAG